MWDKRISKIEDEQRYYTARSIVENQGYFSKSLKKIFPKVESRSYWTGANDLKAEGTWNWVGEPDINFT